MTPSAVAHCPVLIVEDDVELRDMMAQLLTLEGFVATAVANGREALEYLGRGNRPDIILLDLMMPVMDGWQFVAELEHRGRRDVPLLILSADRSVQGHAQQLRASGHLAKPFDLEELLGKVQQLAASRMVN
jgi:CheY-like chemotaxis protein